MPMIQENISLLPYNTFGIDAKAKWFLPVNSITFLIELLADNAFFIGKEVMVLGGGSNVLFAHDFPGIILLNQIKGIEVVEEDDKYIWVRVGGGENWHQFVMYALNQNWGGIENLSLIPGSVGAAPIQNIGAYGVELKAVFHSLEAVHLQTANVHTFDNKACAFGYRDSVFKGNAKGKFFITHVTFRLTKSHALNTSYGAIQAELERLGVTQPKIQDVSQAVINIRQSKLPDPAQIGNAGSFFKNPVVEQRLFERLLKAFPNIPHYPQAGGKEKLAAAWLIDQAGWKGRSFGNYGVHDRQALVLVNHGGAKGREIWDLSQKIQADVKSKFNISLETEVNMI